MPVLLMKGLVSSLLPVLLFLLVQYPGFAEHVFDGRIKVQGAEYDFKVKDGASLAGIANQHCHHRPVVFDHPHVEADGNVRYDGVGNQVDCADR